MRNEKLIICKNLRSEKKKLMERPDVREKNWERNEEKPRRKIKRNWQVEKLRGKPGKFGEIKEIK